MHEKHEQARLRLFPSIRFIGWLLSAVICCLQCEDKLCGLLAWTTMEFYKLSTEFQLKLVNIFQSMKKKLHSLLETGCD